MAYLHCNVVDMLYSSFKPSAGDAPELVQQENYPFLPCMRGRVVEGGYLLWQRHCEAKVDQEDCAAFSIGSQAEISWFHIAMN